MSLLTIEEVLSKTYPGYYHNQKQLARLMELEQTIVEKYGKYKISGINIGRRVPYELSPRGLKDLIRRMSKNIASNVLGNYLLGYTWKLEEGDRKELWHAHLVFFWRSNVDNNLLTRELVCYFYFLNLFERIGEISLQMTGTSQMNKVIMKNNEEMRNGLYTWLRYLCKEKIIEGEDRDVNNTGRLYLDNIERHNGIDKGERRFGCSLRTLNKNECDLPDYDLTKISKEKTKYIFQEGLESVLDVRKSLVIEYMERNKGKWDMFPGCYLKKIEA